jgi:hypothetical protein
MKDGSETDMDCGGGSCLRCAAGKSCNVWADCTTFGCVGGVCQPESCFNDGQDGSETDLDCGGSICVPCRPGKSCNVGADCLSNSCVGGVCV